MLRVAYWILGGIILVCLLPIISALISGLVANTAGCELNEGSVHPCIILGMDWGDTLYFGAMMAWFGLMTLPVAGLAVLGIALLGAGQLIYRLFSRK